MFERIMILGITIIWIAMLLVLICLFGWWLVSELVAGVLNFIFVML